MNPLQKIDYNLTPFSAFSSDQTHKHTQHLFTHGKHTLALAVALFHQSHLTTSPRPQRISAGQPLPSPFLTNPSQSYHSLVHPTHPIPS